MASPLIQYDKLIALASDGGYNSAPALTQLSAVFLLSSCTVMRMQWLWQNPIAPITPGAYQDILEMIDQAEADLMTSFAIGQVIPTVSDQSGNDALLALDGSTVATADYPELAAVVPASWIVGPDIQLPDLQEKSIHGENGSNIGSIIGENAVTLQISEMPAHTHTQQPHNHSYIQPVVSPITAGIEPVPGSLTTPTPTVTGSTVAINNDTGGDQPHNNISESLTVFWWIVAR